ARLRNDKEVVMVAIRQRGITLQYASEQLRNDPEVVLIAIKENTLAIRYASDNVRQHPDILAYFQKHQLPENLLALH
ncbi:MAG: DUF4116 domain-containing protein, partial [Candidatus Magasanikbacteria bacterium]|nr:DUF4116 domain-containing protein [Candidatus Magasanikbacteria bacterium]